MARAWARRWRSWKRSWKNTRREWSFQACEALQLPSNSCKRWTPSHWCRSSSDRGAAVNFWSVTAIFAFQKWTQVWLCFDQSWIFWNFWWFFFLIHKLVPFLFVWLDIANCHPFSVGHGTGTFSKEPIGGPWAPALGCVHAARRRGFHRGGWGDRQGGEVTAIWQTNMGNRKTRWMIFSIPCYIVGIIYYFSTCYIS